MRQLLIIHTGQPLSAQRRRCVLSAIRLYPDFEPFWVNKFNADELETCILHRLGLSTAPPAWNRDSLIGRTLFSDWCRAYVLSENLQMLYADTDVDHLKRFEFDDSSTEPYIMGPPADSAMMYSANACDYWQRLLDEKIRRQDWGNPQDAMNGGDGTPITREYYRHYGASENHHLAEDAHWWLNNSGVHGTNYKVPCEAV